LCRRRCLREQWRRCPAKERPKGAHGRTLTRTGLLPGSFKSQPSLDITGQTFEAMTEYGC
jgi:hypothetical protein